MKQSLLRAPKAGFALRGKTKKVPLPIFNPQGSPNSECLDVSFSASPPPISIITDNLSVTSSNSVTAAAGDLDEVESSYSMISLLLENSDQSGLSEFPPVPLLEPVGAATENLREASSSVEPALFTEDIVRGGRSCAEEILTESSEMTAQPEAQIIVGNCSAEDEGERNLELAIAGFSEAMEKLCDAIREVLLPQIEQRKRRNGSDGVFFFLVRVGELTLAFFIGAVLVSVLLIAVASEGYLILNNLSEFNGPAPS
ncbi:uncharacterized protein LOC110106517 [Dendrobium catenatum]|uniref:Uncharacterized protein n=1 Tax=Dendrobium catenatum TaxID=906689 RepID=A0A2I0WV09_9ASPA|nr:uncharacterized protein LOC110106517 [Dendrobium catenatum]XP_028550896.1 uncharacterized protein LOC110106517 [Dendrobium catenatum]PKU79463.1 hypothetical protein MA16_Dca000808 [Dendrobium catenatum]